MKDRSEGGQRDERKVRGAGWSDLGEAAESFCHVEDGSSAATGEAAASRAHHVYWSTSVLLYVSRQRKPTPLRHSVEGIS